MKMTSVNLATVNLNYSNNSSSTEFSSATETSELMHSKSHNDPYYTIQEDEISELNKSELDIEIEMCEELLNSESMEFDLTECFDKENFSDLSEFSDSDSVHFSKKPKIDILKSRNVGQCKNFLNYEIESQNDVNITLLSKNCLQNAKKSNEIINDNVLCNEEQLSLSDLKNMHTTIIDSVISKCEDQLNLPLEKSVKIALITHNAENHCSKENNDIPLKYTFNEFEKKGVNILAGLSAEAEDKTAIIECQNVEQRQNFECDELKEISMGENTTLFPKDCSETSCISIKNLNDNVPGSTISVLEEQHSLNLDVEILSCNGEIKFPLESYEANSLKNTDFSNEDIENNNTVKFPINDQCSDIVPDLTLSVLEKSPSTNLVCDILKRDSQIKCPIENDKTSTLKDDGFVIDQESNKQHNYKEKDDDELSIAESDVSTIEEFEMSILDATDNDEQSMTNERDEILLPSSEKKEKEDKKTVSSIIVNVSTEKFSEQIKASEEEILLDPKAGKIKHLSTNDSALPSTEGDENTVSTIVHVPEKPSVEADEKKDLLDPRWDKIKQLSTDEERYQQVKNCWKCSKVPDPNKNLTHHSFRKRHFKNTAEDQPKQRKRMASNNLNEHSAKRSRSCTYHLDNQILTVSAKERQETEKIMLEMNNEINRVNRSFEQEIQRQYNPNRGYNFGQLQANLENKIASIRSQYSQQADHYIHKVESEIRALNVARNEVLQFYKFYKGLNSRNDPTVLTFEQNLELEEIENVYSKFNQLYK